jgi:hypothetical protein
MDRLGYPASPARQPAILFHGPSPGNQKPSRSLRALSAFAVKLKPELTAKTRRAQSVAKNFAEKARICGTVLRRVFDQWENSFQLAKDFGLVVQKQPLSLGSATGIRTLV